MFDVVSTIGQTSGHATWR